MQYIQTTLFTFNFPICNESLIVYITLQNISNLYKFIQIVYLRHLKKMCVIHMRMDPRNMSQVSSTLYSRETKKKF